MLAETPVAGETSRRYGVASAEHASNWNWVSGAGAPRWKLTCYHSCGVCMVGRRGSMQGMVARKIGSMERVVGFVSSACGMGYPSRAHDARSWRTHALF